MRSFKVEIEETLKRVVTKKAETPEEAIEKVEEEYDATEIVLDAEDFQGKEIRIEGELSKDYVFNISTGQAVLLDGNEELAIIKRLSNHDEYDNFIIVSGLKYNSKDEMFEWRNGSYYNNILAAVQEYDERLRHKLDKELSKQKGEIPDYRKIELYDTLLNQLFELENYSEAILKLYKEYDLSVEEISKIASSSKEDIYNVLENCIKDEDVEKYKETVKGQIDELVCGRYISKEECEFLKENMLELTRRCLIDLKENRDLEEEINIIEENISDMLDVDIRVTREWVIREYQEEEEMENE